MGEVRLLSELKPGERGKVVKVSGSGAVHRRILDMGVVPGAEIEVERVAPLGDPVEFKLLGYHLSLRKEEARNVHVEVS
jgi:Fe2+ transport system protein FeoA